MDAADQRITVRTTELLGVLSLGADLGMGQPMEHVVRGTRIALRMGAELGLDDEQLAVVCKTSLVAWVGCHIDAYEQAKWFGDDLALKGDSREADMRGFGPVKFVLSHLGAGRPPSERVRIGAAFLAGGARDMTGMLANHAYAADDLTARLELGDAVRESVAQTFERWDGKGEPNRARGDEIHLAARVVNIADVLEVFHNAGGADAAVAVARERRDTQFDPMLVDLVCDNAPAIFADLDTATTWNDITNAAGDTYEPLADDKVDGALEAIADFTDMKSPYTLGHSRSVAELGEAAGREFGLGATETKLLRRVGYVHDLGRLGVSNSIWDKRGALSASEQERVRLHPYLTERMLAFCPPLAPLGEIAVQQHERLDGSGYPRGLTGDALTPTGRILAAADAYRGKIEPRPHRTAAKPDEVAAALRADVHAKRLDGDAVDAVLRAAGHRVTRRREWPAGLTTREVEVLRLVARGYTNKQIAEALVISPKTAGNHVEHIYTKIGVSNRARAGFFAMKHGLMTAADAEDGVNTS